jgi:hypothetical protein
MATSSLAKQVSELRRLIEARGLAASTPIYLREGSPIPDGVDPGRVVFVSRQFVEPPDHPEEPPIAVPEATRSEANGHDRAARRLEYPPLGLV